MAKRMSLCQHVRGSGEASSESMADVECRRTVPNHDRQRKTVQLDTIEWHDLLVFRRAESIGIYCSDSAKPEWEWRDTGRAGHNIQGGTGGFAGCLRAGRYSLHLWAQV